jgi:hypothetical protein
MRLSARETRIEVTAFELGGETAFFPDIGFDRLLGARAEDRSGILHRGRIADIAGDDHRRSHLRHAVEVLGKFGRKAHAAVAGGIARQVAGMERDPLPGQPLHMRHRRILELARIVVLGLLQDGENAGRRLEAFLARRASRDTDENAVAVDEAALLGDRNDDGDGAFGRPLGVPDELAGLEIFAVLARRPCRRAAPGASPPRGLGQCLADQVGPTGKETRSENQ